MELIINGRVHSQVAKEQEIGEGLSHLTGDGDSFAILARDEMTYIQCAGSPDVGFDLEYQAGSVDEHFRCAGDGLPLESIEGAFRSYLRGSEEFLGVCEWEKVDFSAHSPEAGTFPWLAVTVALLAVALLLWFALK